MRFYISKVKFKDYKLRKKLLKEITEHANNIILPHFKDIEFDGYYYPNMELKIECKLHCLMSKSLITAHIIKSLGTYEYLRHLKVKKIRLDDWGDYFKPILICDVEKHGNTEFVYTRDYQIDRTGPDIIKE